MLHYCTPGWSSSQVRGRCAALLYPWLVIFTSQGTLCCTTVPLAGHLHKSGDAVLHYCTPGWSSSQVRGPCAALLYPWLVIFTSQGTLYCTTVPLAGHLHKSGDPVLHYCTPGWSSSQVRGRCAALLYPWLVIFTSQGTLCCTTVPLAGHLHKPGDAVLHYCTPGWSSSQARGRCTALLYPWLVIFTSQGTLCCTTVPLAGHLHKPGDAVLHYCTPGWSSSQARGRCTALLYPWLVIFTSQGTLCCTTVPLAGHLHKPGDPVLHYCTPGWSSSQVRGPCAALLYPWLVIFTSQGTLYCTTVPLAGHLHKPGDAVLHYCTPGWSSSQARGDCAALLYPWLVIFTSQGTLYCTTVPLAGHLHKPGDAVLHYCTPGWSSSQARGSCAALLYPWLVIFTSQGTLCCTTVPLAGHLHKPGDAVLHYCTPGWSSSQVRGPCAALLYPWLVIFTSQGTLCCTTVPLAGHLHKPGDAVLHYCTPGWSSSQVRGPCAALLYPWLVIFTSQGTLCCTTVPLAGHLHKSGDPVLHYCTPGWSSSQARGRCTALLYPWLVIFIFTSQGTLCCTTVPLAGHLHKPGDAVLHYCTPAGHLHKPGDAVLHYCTPGWSSSQARGPCAALLYPWLVIFTSQGTLCCTTVPLAGHLHKSGDPVLHYCTPGWSSSQVRGPCAALLYPWLVIFTSQGTLCCTTVPLAGHLHKPGDPVLHYCTPGWSSSQARGPCAALLYPWLVIFTSQGTLCCTTVPLAGHLHKSGDTVLHYCTPGWSSSQVRGPCAALLYPWLVIFTSQGTLCCTTVPLAGHLHKPGDAVLHYCTPGWSSSQARGRCTALLYPWLVIFTSQGTLYCTTVPLAGHLHKPGDTVLHYCTPGWSSSQARGHCAALLYPWLIIFTSQGTLCCSNWLCQSPLCQPWEQCKYPPQFEDDQDGWMTNGNPKIMTSSYTKHCVRVG